MGENPKVNRDNVQVGRRDGGVDTRFAFIGGEEKRTQKSGLFPGPIYL